MRGLLSEEHSFGANPGTKALARHLYTRSRCGKVVVATDRPVVLMAALRKQWLALCRKVQRESASTLNAARVIELRQTVAHMQSLRFAADWPTHQPADVYLATPEQLLHWAPDHCRTLYVTCHIPREHLHAITAWMPKHALIVHCQLQ